MGGVSTDSGDSLNIELNLVPFIDLLSSLVLFLLITAVWVQIAALPANIDTKGTPVVVSNTNNMITVHLNDKGFDILWPPTVVNAGSLPNLIEKKGDAYDLDKLTEVIKSVAGQKEKPSAAVSAEELVDYGEVVRTIDTVKQGGLDSVALSTN